MWETKAETIDAETSPSLLCNNLSVSKDILVFAHLEDVVVINPKSTTKPSNKITLVEKAVVYQAHVCDLGGELYLVIATESGFQVWDIQGEHLHYSFALAKEMAPVEDIHPFFCRGICNDDKTIFVGSSAARLFTLALEPGQSKGQVEFTMHTTSTTNIHNEPIHSLSVPKDEAKATILCSGDDDGVLVVWSIESSKSLEVKYKLKPTGYPITSLKCLNSLWCLTGDTTGKLRVVNLTEGYISADVGAHTRNLSALDVNDNQVVTIGEDGYIHVWKVNEHDNLLKISLEHSHRVGDDVLTGVVFGSSSVIYTSTYDQNHIKVWKRQ